LAHCRAEGTKNESVPYTSIKAISINQGKEKVIWTVISSFSGISTQKPGKSGNMVLDITSTIPESENKPRWV